MQSTADAAARAPCARCDANMIRAAGELENADLLIHYPARQRCRRCSSTFGCFERFPVMCTMKLKNEHHERIMRQFRTASCATRPNLLIGVHHVTSDIYRGGALREESVISLVPWAYYCASNHIRFRTWFWKYSHIARFQWSCEDHPQFEDKIAVAAEAVGGCAVAACKQLMTDITTTAPFDAEYVSGVQSSAPSLVRSTTVTYSVESAGGSGLSTSGLMELAERDYTPSCRGLSNFESTLLICARLVSECIRVSPRLALEGYVSLCPMQPVTPSSVVLPEVVTPPKEDTTLKNHEERAIQQHALQQDKSVTAVGLPVLPEALPPSPTDEPVRSGELPTLGVDEYPAGFEEAPSSSASDRVVTNGEICALIGQDVTKCKNGFEKAVRPGAIAIGPNLASSSMHRMTEANVMLAKQKRYDEKTHAPCPTAGDKASVGKLVRALIKRVFTEKRVRKWRADNPVFADLRSSKWSPERMRNAVDTMLDSFGAPEKRVYRLGVHVKPEVLAFPPGGKPPRLIIVDGDAGQVMSLLTVKCLEEVMFERFELESIKHLDKEESLHRMFSNMRHEGCVAVEGDGSSWDATCNKTVRDAIEMPILDHIAAILHAPDDAEIPVQWTKKAQKVNRAEKLTLQADGGLDHRSRFYLNIAAIRRSGHRGTSCLNWLVNKVMWCASLSATPEIFVNTKVETTALRFKPSVNVWTKMGFEGDDSLLSIDPAVIDVFPDIEACWYRWGFNMKLFIRRTGECATFVGVNTLVDRCGPTTVYMPELRRNLGKAGFTVSQMAIQSVEHGKVSGAYAVGASTYAARAYSFSASWPPVASYFAAVARGCDEMSGGNSTLDREASMRIRGEVTTESIASVLAEADERMRIWSGHSNQVRDLYRHLVFAQTGRVPTASEEAALLQLRKIDPRDSHVAELMVPGDWR
jgi:hypothetical protein